MGMLQQLRTALQTNEIDGILITSPYNRRYVSNFTGTAGAVLVTETEAIFITDFRYTTQAAEQAKGFTIIEHTKSMEEEIARQIVQLDIKQLGFEAEHVTYDTFTRYEQLFAAELVGIKQIIETIRIKKTEEEIAILKEAASIADKAFDHILDVIKPGVREIDVANELEFYMRKLGATSSSFDIIVASGDRSALPHGVASEKKIKNGELVTLDFGALYQGYCSDITRTVAVGDISDELRNIYDVVLEAQKLGVAGLKPGMTGKEADALTRDYITEKGYGDYFGHSTGHGIGLEVHEGPSLSMRSSIVLEPGMVVTVEPGIYIPEVGGCRIEDDVVLTETGKDVLTTAPKSLITL